MLLSLAIVGPWGWWIAAAVVAITAAVGIYDLAQRKHSVLRNYPVLGHMRFLLEALRPELQQYFIERNFDGRPFDRDVRSLIYERAKGTAAELAFGTERDIDAVGYEYLVHSARPVEPPDEPFRVRVGGPDCARPYDMALMNVSAMSFGALSANALRALNNGARKGRFAHDTGEGGLTPYHLGGADVIWELGSGYFGARTADGAFDPDQFADKAAHDLVKCVSIKLSQGAKPGIGGVLPAAKVSAEIARYRGVPVGEKCVSPSAHSAFHTPRELIMFIAKLRELADGKPVGFKLCVGSRVDVLAVCKAMLAEGVTPDFIIVDGAEGGTAAAPLEYEDNIGLPLTDGLMTVHNALVGAGLREQDTDRGGRQSRLRKRHRQAADPGCGLHQLGPIDDDGDRLHPSATVPYQSLPGRRHNPGSVSGPRAGRRRQKRTRVPLPAGHRHPGDAHDGFDGCLRPVDAQPAHAAQAVIADRTAFVRRALRMARARRTAQPCAGLLAIGLGDRRSGFVLAHRQRAQR